MNNSLFRIRMTVWQCALLSSILFVTTLFTSPLWAGVISAEIDREGIVSPDGRVYLSIIGTRHTMTTESGPVWIEEVRVEVGQIDIVLKSIPGLPPPGPVPPPTPEWFLSLVLDNLPPGQFIGRFFAIPPEGDESDASEVGEFSFEVSDSRRHRTPLPVTVWPDAPTVFDPVWLLVEPVNTCADLEARLVSVASTGIVIDELVRPCHENELPELSALPLDGVDSGVFAQGIRYQIDGETSSMAPLGFEIRNALTARLSGSWYNPDEDGHGLTIEILDAETVVAYWFTFDAFGDPAWIAASGNHAGDGLAELEGWFTEGGMFPPSFDPELVEAVSWGSLEIEFHSCSEATLRWEATASGFGSGEMPLQRFTRAAEFSCTDPPPESLFTPDWFRNADFYFRFEEGS
jgi:hypothetical protein